MNPCWLGYALIAQICLTWLMVGLIWFVQIVHYPLFRDVGDGHFLKYESRHTQRTGLVVAMPMLLELFIAVLLAWQVGGFHEIVRRKLVRTQAATKSLHKWQS